MSDLKEKYFKATSIVTDVEKMLETAVDKEAMMRKIVWQMPRGIFNSPGTEKGKLIADAISSCAEELGVDLEEILASDGNLSERDKEILSSVEIETEEKEPIEEDPEDEPTTKVSVTSLDALIEALKNELVEEIELESNMNLASTLTVSNSEKVLDLNGKIITNTTTEYETNEEGKSITSGVDAITVKTGEKLTIEDSTNVGAVKTVSGGGSPIYANGGTVIINGGSYETLNPLDSGKGFSVVYADNGGQVEVNDGYFWANGNIQEAGPYYQYYLNCKDGADGKGALITVKGGYFYEWDPRTHDAITARPQYPEVVIPEGYKVEALENKTFNGHTGTWYHVIASEA